MDDEDFVADFKRKVDTMLRDVQAVDEQRHARFCNAFADLVDGHSVPEVVQLVWWITKMLESQQGLPWPVLAAALAAMHDPNLKDAVIMVRPNPKPEPGVVH